MGQDDSRHDRGAAAPTTVRRGDGAEPRRRRRTAVLALVAVLVAMGGVAAVALVRDDGPRDAAMAYLEALARGDGTTAARLDAQGRQDGIPDPNFVPGAMDLAGDDGLAMASERLSAPAVHDVERLEPSDQDDPATFTVDASYTLAGRTHTATLWLGAVHADGGDDEWHVLSPLLTNVLVSGQVDGTLGITTDPADGARAESSSHLYPGVYELVAPAEGFTPASAPLVVAPNGAYERIDLAAPTLSPTPELASALQAEIDGQVAVCLADQAPTETCGSDRALSFAPSPQLTRVRPGRFEARGTVSIEESPRPLVLPFVVVGTFEYRDGLLTDVTVSFERPE